MDSLQRHEAPEITVFFGTHTEHGDVYLVIPTFGEAIILPRSPE